MSEKSSQFPVYSKSKLKGDVCLIVISGVLMLFPITYWFLPEVVITISNWILVPVFITGMYLAGKVLDDTIYIEDVVTKITPYRPRGLNENELEREAYQSLYKTVTVTLSCGIERDANATDVYLGMTMKTALKDSEYTKLRGLKNWEKIEGIHS